MGRAEVADCIQAWKTPEHGLGLPIPCQALARYRQACGCHQLLTGTGWWFSAMYHRFAGGTRLQALHRSCPSLSNPLGFCQARSQRGSPCLHPSALGHSDSKQLAGGHGTVSPSPTWCGDTGDTRRSREEEKVETRQGKLCC